MAVVLREEFRRQKRRAGLFGIREHQEGRAPWKLFTAKARLQCHLMATAHQQKAADERHETNRKPSQKLLRHNRHISEVTVTRCGRVRDQRLEGNSNSYKI